MIGDTALAPQSGLIKDGTDAGFAADVLEESRRQPVIVDFWATWCGPCKQLGPLIEKAVLEAKGAVKLVKIDIDKHPRVAGQLGVQSIPTVYGFVDGKPADGFMGALPASELKAFIDRLTQTAGGSAPDGAADAIASLLDLAAESVRVGDLGGAAQAYAQVLQADPQNISGLAGLSRVYLAGGEVEQARQIAAMIPAEANGADVLSLRAALDFAKDAPDETAELERRVAADPTDQTARLELANALAGLGEFAEASEHLLALVAADREWNDQAARKALLKVFEAAGSASEVAKQGRRRLSQILFS